jgi:hypothetical protein
MATIAGLGPKPAVASYPPLGGSIEKSPGPHPHQLALYRKLRPTATTADRAILSYPAHRLEHVQGQPAQLLRRRLLRVLLQDALCVHAAPRVHSRARTRTRMRSRPY